MDHSEVDLDTGLLEEEDWRIGKIGQITPIYSLR